MSANGDSGSAARPTSQAQILQCFRITSEVIVDLEPLVKLVHST